MKKLSLTQPPKKSDGRFDDWLFALWRAVASNEYQPLDGDLTSISSLSLTANQILGKDAAGTGWEGKTLIAGDGVSIAHGSSSITLTASELSSPTSVIGYGTGAGGTVTQATSRTTGVTLNKPTGAITLFTSAGSATPETFTVTNGVIAATDTICLSVKSGTNKYIAFVTAVASGSFDITFWTTGGTASDAPVISFSVINGAAS